MDTFHILTNNIDFCLCCYVMLRSELALEKVQMGSRIVTEGKSSRGAADDRDASETHSGEG